MSWAHNGPTAVHFSEEGDGDPLLLIMGLGGSAMAWYRLLPHLQGHGRVISFDNRGTGESARISGRVTMRDMVDDAIAVLDAADVPSAHVLGVSMGGMIAQHLALDHRDRVRSLILGCTSATGRTGAAPWRLMAAAGLSGVAPKQAFDLVLPSLYGRRTRERHRDRIREDVRMRMREATPQATILAQIMAIAGHDVRARLGELDGLAVTVVHGDEDGLVPVARGRSLAWRIPAARMREIAGAGHLLTTDAELETVAAIHEHLAAQLVSS